MFTMNTITITFLVLNVYNEYNNNNIPGFECLQCSGVTIDFLVTAFLPIITFWTIISAAIHSMELCVCLSIYKFIN